jgi:hypothetical protein
MKRVVAVAAASIDAVNAVHANVIHEMKERLGMEALAAGAEGFAAVAFGGAGVGGAIESCLLIGISRELIIINNLQKLLQCFQ